MRISILTKFAKELLLHVVTMSAFAFFINGVGCICGFCKTLNKCFAENATEIFLIAKKGQKKIPCTFREGIF
jgi:hypothetical protein